MRAPDEWTKAIALHNIGILYQSQGRYDEALRCYNDSLRIQQALGNQAGIAGSLHEIGILHQSQGRYDEALRCYNDSLRIEQALGNQAGIANSFGQIGRLHIARNESKTAIRYTLRALVIFHSLASPSAEIVTDHLSYIRGQIGETEFAEIVQTEMRDIERRGPYVIS
ncbi:tetratricopeptide repeat protein [Candidatus Poribacteria bacterium]|nr:tetratricopeptide repeat protein [Candidatus Poribacteria bacterium]